MRAEREPAVDALDESLRSKRARKERVERPRDVAVGPAAERHVHRGAGLDLGRADDAPTMARPAEWLRLPATPARSSTRAKPSPRRASRGGRCSGAPGVSAAARPHRWRPCGGRCRRHSERRDGQRARFFPLRVGKRGRDRAGHRVEAGREGISGVAKRGAGARPRNHSREPMRAPRSVTRSKRGRARNAAPPPCRRSRARRAGGGPASEAEGSRPAARSGAEFIELIQAVAPAAPTSPRAPRPRSRVRTRTVGKEGLK
jgi:hypothetical protein